MGMVNFGVKKAIICIFFLKYFFVLGLNVLSFLFPLSGTVKLFISFGLYHSKSVCFALFLFMGASLVVYSLILSCFFVVLLSLTWFSSTISNIFITYCSPVESSF